MEEYIVTEESRKLWAVELDLLAKFKEICSKYGLKYYAIGGTLLGAARHQGFIPWDDDIDILIPWEDYKKFMEVSSVECQYPYFFQCHLTEKNSEISNARLRRSDTTGCTKWEYLNMADPEYNKGVFIDIFPIFNVPEDEETRIKMKESIMEAWKASRGFTALEGEANGLLHVNPEYKKYIDIYRKYSEKYTIQEIKNLYFERCAAIKEPTGIIGAVSFRTFDAKNMWKASWFEETVELPFENTTITCPKYYDEVLTVQYGDWRTPVYNGAYHEMFVVDTEVPFSIKLKKEDEKK